MTTPNREQHVNLAVTQLDGSINNSVTSLDVIDGSVFPSTGNFRVIVDSEVMIVTARSTDTLTVVRGQDGSAAASHTSAAEIAMIYTKEGITRLFQDEIGLWGYASQPAVSGVYDANGEDRIDGSDFTWVNQGGASVASNGDSLTMRCPTDSSTNLRMLAITPGGGSWAYVAAMRGVAGSDGTAEPQIGIGMRESGTGKVIAIGWAASFSLGQKLILKKWTDEDTLTTTEIAKRCVMNRHLLWFKAEYDGTDVIFSISPDGFEWIEVWNEPKATFFTTAPDQIMWFGCNYQNSTAGATELVVSLDHWHKE